jgi:hypothetical protein
MEDIVKKQDAVIFNVVVSFRSDVSFHYTPESYEGEQASSDASLGV